MKVVFVAQNSSYTHTNSAVRILSCALSPRHDTDIVETTVNDRGGTLSLVQRLFEKQAELYAFSVYIWNKKEQFAAASALKKLLPCALILFGGPEVSFEKEDFFERYPFADYLVRGEGERALNEVADGKHSPKTIIDGGIFDGFAESDEPYFSNRYAKGGAEGMLVYYEASRGCPYNCSYCLSSVKRAGERVRFKSEDKVKLETERLMSENVRTIKFVDRTFNADAARAKRLFSHFISLSERALKDGKYVGPMLHFEICAALLDDETTELLSRAPKGLFQFEIGVQTTTPESLKAIGRRDDTEKILYNVKKLREKTDVAVHLDLICGLPLDTYATVKRSFDAVYGLCDCLQVGILKLLPGTRMRAEAEKYGIEYLDDPPYTVLCTSSLSFSELRNLSRVGEAAERFSEVGNAYFNSVGYLVGRIDSPFEFYDALSAYLGELGSISSKKLYSVLLRFGVQKFALDQNEKEYFSELLRYDFTVSNQGTPPAEIDRKYTAEEKELLAREKHAVIRSAPKGESGLFIPALEAHIFGFDTENIYIIDRKNKSVIKKKIT